jgi:hypothetical protein
MQHHVYAVWDFMSLIKSLQIHLAPTKLPWIPPKNTRYANFINQLVLEEESDHVLIDNTNSTHASHFESYCLAMADINADTRPIMTFIDTVNTDGLETALLSTEVPTPAKIFMRFTFEIIARNQVHLLAAMLAYGRENAVPQFFTSLRNRLQMSSIDAPTLYAYLDRHIQLDEQEHGPLTVLMTQELCEDSCEKWTQVIEVAEQALEVRLNFWNAIHEALPVQSKSCML